MSFINYIFYFIISTYKNQIYHLRKSILHHSFKKLLFSDKIMKEKKQDRLLEENKGAEGR